MTEKPGEVLRGIISEHKVRDLTIFPVHLRAVLSGISHMTISSIPASLRLDAQDEEKFRDCDLMLFDKVIAFDNLKQKIVLIANIALDMVQENYDRAKRDLERQWQG